MVNRRFIVVPLHRIPDTLHRCRFHFAASPEHGKWELDTRATLSEGNLKNGGIGLISASLPTRTMTWMVPGVDIVVEILWSPSVGILIGNIPVADPRLFNDVNLPAEDIDILDSKDPYAVFEYAIELF